MLHFGDDGGPYRFLDLFDFEDVKVKYRQPLLEEKSLDVFLRCIDGELKDNLAEVVSRCNVLYLESRPIRNEIRL